MKSVIITGYRGFIGSYVTKTCLDEGWQVYGIDCGTYAANNMLHEWGYESHKNLKINSSRIENLEHLPEAEYIINLAAETHVDRSIAGSKEFISSNISGVHNLLEIIRTKRGYNMPILLHFSTDEVFGDIEIGSHIETDIIKPSNPYSATKASADLLIQTWYRTYGIPYIIVRPTNNYGIGQYIEKLIPKSIKYLTLNKRIPLHNNGSPIRSWIHAQDTADAVIKLIKTKVQNEIYNIGGSNELSNLEVINKILTLHLNTTKYNINDYINTDINRPGQDIRYSLNDSKLRSLGWSPKKNFNDELPKIVDYYKQNFIW